jgi:hypothetical protein
VNQAQNQQARNPQAQDLRATEAPRRGEQSAKASAKAANAPAPAAASPVVAAPPPQLAAAAPAPAASSSTPPRDEEKRVANERAQRERGGGDAKAEAATPPAEVAKEADAKPAAEAGAAGALTESVSTRTATAAGRQPTSARRKDAPAASAFGFAGATRGAIATFAEPEGRRRWRIAADARHIESSSDGGATWTTRYDSKTLRLRAGSAPSIDVAWVVGERGLVLRRAVPGDWAAVSPPASATLTAVTATSADAARVTVEDGRVFVTADGGRTWSPGTAGPP